MSWEGNISWGNSARLSDLIYEWYFIEQISVFLYEYTKTLVGISEWLEFRKGKQLGTKFDLHFYHEYS